MVAYFIGGMLGSVIASDSYQLSGWTAVCTLGATTATAGLTIWGLLHRLIEHENLSRRTKVIQDTSTRVDNISNETRRIHLAGLRAGWSVSSAASRAHDPNER
jgi:hypothetical protein